MWKSVALVCVLVVLIVIAEAGPRNKNKGAAAAVQCQYTKGDWSTCTGGQMTRTMTLNPGQASTCEATKTITKKCKAKGGKAAKQACKYNKKVPWSACTNGKMTRTVTLKGRKTGCEATKVETKDCKA